MEKQLVQLYDEEFLKQQSDYPAQLKKEVDQKKKDGYTISNFVVAEKDDVKFSEVDGKEWQVCKPWFHALQGADPNHVLQFRAEKSRERTMEDRRLGKDGSVGYGV